MYRRSMPMMIQQEKADRGSMQNIDEYIPRGAIATTPRDIPMPRWCKEKLAAETTSSGKNLSIGLLDAVGDLLKFYSQLPASHGSPAIIDTSQPDIQISSSGVLGKSQHHITTVGAPGLKEHFESAPFPSPKKLLMPNTKPLIDAADNYRNLAQSTPPQSEGMTDGFSKTPRSSVPLLPLHFGTRMAREFSPGSCSTSASTEPEPSPTNSVDRAFALSVLAGFDSQVQFDDFPAARDQSPTNGGLSDWQPECDQQMESLTTTGQKDPNIQFARKIAADGGGLSGYATVMIQQIPFKYSQGKLLKEITENGFVGTYDFFYLPANARNHGNRGFGFINFLSSSLADEFYSKYHGKTLKDGEANLPIAVVPADTQGFEQSVACFFSSWQLRKKKRHSMPVCLRPVPGKLRSQGKVTGTRAVEYF